MKKILFAYLSAVLAAVMIFTVSSCTNKPAETTTDTEIAADQTTAQETTQAVTTEETTTEAVAATEETTEEITTEEETTVEVTAEETTAEETTGEVTGEETKPSESGLIYQEYAAAVEKTNALADTVSNHKVEQSISLTMPNGESFNTKSSSEMNQKISGRDGDDMKCYMKETDRSESETGVDTTQTEIYADKDKIYVKNSNTDGFTVVDRSDPSAQAVNAILNPENSKTELLPEEAFSNAEIKDNEDGSKTIHLKPEDSSISGTFDGIKEQLDAVFRAMGASEVNFTASKTDFIFVISADGYIIRSETQMILTFFIVISNNPVQAVSVASSVSEFPDPGKPVMIEMPTV